MNEKEIVKFRITSVASPTQIEGRLTNGNDFYIRYRGGNYYFEEYDKCMQTGADNVFNKFSTNISVEDPYMADFMNVYEAFDIAGIVLSNDSVIEIQQNIKPVGWTWVKQPFMTKEEKEKREQKLHDVITEIVDNWEEE